MTDSGSVKLMSLNCNKAGMAGLDKEKINQIIEECSKGSKFYKKKQQDQLRIDGQVEELKSTLSRYSQQQIDRARRDTDKIVNGLRQERDLSRTIVHVDMDMFYAAVEMRDNPALRGVPMAVGGMGMLSTSNYAARKFGVRAAMPGFIAKKLCPNLVIVPGNMEKYAAVSEVVRGVFKEYDPNFAPMSLDEAYLDLTDLLAELQSTDSQKSAWSLVEEMRQKIFERTQLTASAGIAPNCFLAKVCSDLNKPNGQHELQPDPDEIMKFVSDLHIRKVGGIGNVQEQMLKGVGVSTCKDLYEKRGEIRLVFSELSSDFYLAVSQGIGSNRIEPPEERERKSISTETTFSDTSDRQELLKILADLCKDLASDCISKAILGHAVTVKIKSHDFKIKTKVTQLCDYSNDEEVIHATAKRILLNMIDTSEDQPLALRLMGVRLSNLQDKESSSSKSRQSNLLTLIKNQTSTSKREEETNFSCPICDANCENLNDLNIHIDSCLSDKDKKKEAETVNDNFSTLVNDDVDDLENEPETLTTNKVSVEKRINTTSNIEDIIKIDENGGSLSFFQTEKLEDEMPEREIGNKAKTEVTDEPCLDQNMEEGKNGTEEIDNLMNISQEKSKSDSDLSEACPHEVQEFNDVNDERSPIPSPIASSSVHCGESKFEESELSSSCYGEEAEDRDTSLSSFSCEKSKPAEEKEFQCPVCFNKTFKNEILLSNHVEECLSKQAISSLLKSEVSTYSVSSAKANNLDKNNKKRKASEAKKKTDKRCKVEASKNHRIDAFFKLKSRSTDLKL